MGPWYEAGHAETLCFFIEAGPADVRTTLSAQPMKPCPTPADARSMPWFCQEGIHATANSGDKAKLSLAGRGNLRCPSSDEKRVFA